MAFGFKRIIDLSSLSIKLLNDQLEQLWLKTMGGIGRKDLDPQLQNVINSKVGEDNFVSLLQQNQEEISMMVGSSDAGDNLVTNGNGSFRIEGWTVGAGDGTNEGEGGFVVQNAIAQYGICIEAGADYSFGFDYRGKLRVEVAYQRLGSLGTNAEGKLVEMDCENASGWTEIRQNVPAPDDAHTIYIKFYNDAPNSGDVKGIFFRKGKNVTTYTQHPDEINGSSVKISKESVDIRTQNFRLDLLNSKNEITSTLQADQNGFDRIICQNIRLRGYEWFGEVAITLYVDSVSGSDCNDGSTRAKAYKTIAKALKRIPLSHYDARIYLNGKTYYELLRFEMGGNGSMHIYGEGAKLYGLIDVRNSSHQISLYQLSIYGNSNIVVKTTTPNSLIYMENCLLDGGSVANSAGGYFSNGSRGIFNNCQINNCTYATHVSFLSMVGMYSCKGKNNSYSLYTMSCGYMIVDGTVPHATVMLNESSGGTVYGDFIASQLTTDYTAPSPSTTLYYFASALATKQNDTWIEKQLIQGHTWDKQGAPIVHQGFLLFPQATIRTKLLGKNLYSCMLVIKRKRTDPTEIKKLELWGHTATSLSGTPNLVKNYGLLATIASGERSFLNLPIAALVDLVEGRVQGFCFHTDSPDVEFCAELETSPLPYLEIQYK